MLIRDRVGSGWSGLRFPRQPFGIPPAEAGQQHVLGVLLSSEGK